MAKESKTAKAVRNAVEAGKEKKVEVKLTNQEMISQIRSNLAAGLFVGNMDFIRALMEEYDKEQTAVTHLAGSTSALLKRAEAAEAKYTELVSVMNSGPSTSETSQAELEPLPVENGQ